MHKCVNNTVGNIYHLEQMVDNFFPYSQKQLGFDKDATIVFQSDEDNAGRMLGKTAYYDPQNYQIVLYTDGRHPKDILRSLSHELVHHNQNCRGDFTTDNATDDGYAQEDPHLRNMESEAYEIGNLIFRDFEDLIKTGKINIEIDFSDSGEPKMSLKEWKNNEINTKLMKKWGLLKEGRGGALEPWTEPPDGYRDWTHGNEEGDDPDASRPADINTDFAAAEEDRLHGFLAAAAKDNPGASKKYIHNKALEMLRKADYDRAMAATNENSLNKEGKISVREAKEITRRILERIKKETK